MTTLHFVAGILGIGVLTLLFIYAGAKLGTAGILQARHDFEARRKAAGNTRDHN